MARKELEQLETIRLESLFSIYNPENALASQEKLQFWRKMIHLELGNSFTLNPLGLEQKFEVNGLFPLCLNAILSEMLSEGSLVGKEKKGILHSIFYYLYPQSTEITKSKELLICTSIFEKFKEAVLSSLPPKDPIDSDQLIELFDRAGLAKSDHEYLIHHLVATKKLSTLSNRHITIYSSDHILLSEEELGKSVVKRSIRSLKSQNATLEEKINDLKSSISQALTTKSKLKALTLLKHKKLVEKQVSANEEKLLNLEQLLQSISSAQDNVHLLQSYKLGSAALKNILGKEEMATAQETMDDMFDILEECREVHDIIASATVDVAEEDLEKELEKMINDERGVDELRKQLEALQTVTVPLPDNISISKSNTEILADKSPAQHLLLGE